MGISHLKNSGQLPLRVDKTLQWLEESRDSWKDKTKESKEELKKKTLAVKRARESRDLLQEQLKEERRKSQEELNQKETEIAELKAQLERAHQQVEELKKKRLLQEQENLATMSIGIAL